MYVPPIINKYEYEKYSRINSESGRKYITPTGNLPSVTTILSATKENQGLKNWRKFVGDVAADEITLEATTIGTFMHENLENRLLGKEDHQGNMPVRVLGRKMADVIQEHAWPNITELWGQEVGLYYSNQWAGTTDIVGLYKNIPTIMDYKNSRKPKTWEYVEDYRLQLAAYALAHNERYNTNIEQGIIFICVRQDTKNLQYQEFLIEGTDFKDAIDMWLERVDKYYTMEQHNGI